jgi:NAD(P)-dependent dehydrogenase (short-subunit alcohol dehydrogenase family)
VSGSLDDLSILVTGGGSGIGRAVVEAYLRAGARVTVLERSAQHRDELLSQHPAVSVVLGDATDAGTLDRAIAAAVRPDGGLDQLTCCVGVFDNYASLRDLPADTLSAAAEEIWRTNVLSGLLAVNRAYPRLATAHGSVTLTLSGSAFHAEGGGVLYGSSKWALRGVVAHLSSDLAPAVRVNGVSPGGTAGTRLAGPASLGPQTTADRVPGRSERIRAGNLLQLVPEPQDHAAAYVYLADPVAARVCTGVIVCTDGGRV